MPNDATDRREVTYITPGGDMMIRHESNNMAAMCQAAELLKASHFVTQDGFDEAQNLPVWAVFDMRRCDKDNPHPRAYSMGPALREFVSETSDAAVMFALHTRNG